MSSLSHQDLVKNYQVIRVLGQGSFGKVFLIRHKQLRMQYAMKKYSKYHILKNGKQKSIIRSSRILQVLQHQGIIKFLYYVISDQDDQIFLIFQACKKGSLQQIKSKIFNIKQFNLIKQIMYQLTQALLYLKSVAVAHRDLKPSNISFNSQGQLKLIDFDQAICFKQSEELNNKDFGFARSFSQQTSSLKLYSRRSQANSFVGTQMYMSPEMRHNTTTDERGDIWAYGCIFYQLVSGRSLMTEQDDDIDSNCDVETAINALYQQLPTYGLKQSQIDIIIHLLKNVLQQIPEYRMPVQKIIEHQFFEQYQNVTKKLQHKIKLRKFLKGNFNLSDPRYVLDALNMDLIGMSSGNQKFQQLTLYPILLHYQILHHISLNSFNSIKQYLHHLLNFNFFKVNYIIGGTLYFKIRSAINQKNKQYIFYNQIDNIKIVSNSIIIQGSNIQKWNIRNGQQYTPYKWRYTIKSLTNDQLQLGILYDTFLYIFND